MEGIITKINSDLYTVRLNNKKRVKCKCRGIFRKEKIKPLVGDKVFVNLKVNVIEKIFERKNELIRPLVSNIDKLFIIVSTHIPRFSSYLLDKYLILAHKNHIEPVIIITKFDLLDAKNKLEVKEYIKYYKKIGYSVYLNTEKTKIKKEFKGSVVALIGQTGAGKTTLLNKIDKTLGLETNEVSIRLGRGKHTTRVVELFELFDGFIVDTPGFSSLELYNITKEDIRNTFIEFPLGCKYRTCMHDKEIDCAVKEKLKQNNYVYKSRYKNYIKLIQEVKK